MTEFAVDIKNVTEGEEKEDMDQLWFFSWIINIHRYIIRPMVPSHEATRKALICCLLSSVSQTADIVTLSVSFRYDKHQRVVQSMHWSDHCDSGFLVFIHGLSIFTYMCSQ